MKWVIAYLICVVSSVISAVLIAFIGNGLNNKIALISLFIGLGTSIYFLVQDKNITSGIKKEELGTWSWLVIIFFILFSLRSFIWLIFKSGNSLFISSPHNLGDLSLHITYITNLASGVSFWPDNPILTGAKLRYPIGIDLFNSLLLLMGVDLVRGLIWVGLLSSVATLLTLLAWGRTFTLAGFLFNGGLAGFIFFTTLKLTNHQFDVDWKSIPLTLFITQRGYLFAVPAGLLLLSSWRERFFNSQTSNNHSGLLLPLWVEVLFYSTMPIFHMHTFVYLTLLLGFWFLFLPKEQKVKIFKLAVLSFVPVFLFVVVLTGFIKGTSIIHIKAGWEQGNKNFFEFWLSNFGLFLPLVIFLLYKTMIKKEAGKARLAIELNSDTAFIFPAVLLFIFFCFVMLHPASWDNIKVLMWSYLILLPYIWREIISKSNIYLKYIICFVLFFSGFTSILESMSLNHKYEIFKLDEIYGVSSAVKNLPVQYRFASYPTYNHPLLYAGRKVVLGYPGHIWVHGFAYSDVEMKLKRLMLGDPEWKQLAKELNVKYIFWGERESHEYSTSTKPWELNSQKVASCSYGDIYDLGNLQ